MRNSKKSAVADGPSTKLTRITAFRAAAPCDGWESLEPRVLLSVSPSPGRPAVPSRAALAALAAWGTHAPHTPHALAKPVKAGPAVGRPARHPVHAPRGGAVVHNHLFVDARPRDPHYIGHKKTQPVPPTTSHAAVTLNATPFTGDPIPFAGLSPQQMRGAYGVPAVAFNGLAGTGAGQTIAIVDPYDDPSFVNSTSPTFALSDLALFDKQFGLPDPPSFTKYGVDLATDTVTATLPGTDPAGPARTTGVIGSELEISLDVEWAHALAPSANIVLIETGDPNVPDSGYKYLFDGVAAADNLGNVNVVSMSFGGPESQLGAATEKAFQDPNDPNGNGIFAVPGISYVASSGDSGAYDSGGTRITPQVPAALTNVLAVGGTTLSVAGNTYSGETTWGNGTSSGTAGGGGGGLSLYEPVPAYQSGVTGAVSTTNRAYPDVSMDANPSSGVPVLDSWDFGSGTGWYPGTIGGTSLSAPMMGALVAIAGQGRAAANLLPLDSSAQPGDVDVHTLLYNLAKHPGVYAADYHDITGGNAIGPTSPAPSYAPAAGYDLATGLGSPVANTLLPDLAAPLPTAAFTVDDASAQRSELRSLTVTFNTPVTLQAGALTLTQRAGPAGAAGGSVPLTIANPGGDGKTYVLTFSGASGPALEYGSLPDGVYDLTTHASAVTNAAGQTMTADAILTFHRLFGDTDGDKNVTNLDYAAFRNAYGSVNRGAGYNASLDVDGDGNITNLDYAAFRLRYGTGLSY